MFVVETPRRCCAVLRQGRTDVDRQSGEGHSLLAARRRWRRSRGRSNVGAVMVQAVVRKRRASHNEVAHDRSLVLSIENEATACQTGSAPHTAPRSVSRLYRPTHLAAVVHDQLGALLYLFLISRYFFNLITPTISLLRYHRPRATSCTCVRAHARTSDALCKSVVADASNSPRTVKASAGAY